MTVLYFDKKIDRKLTESRACVRIPIAWIWRRKSFDSDKAWFSNSIFCLIAGFMSSKRVSNASFSFLKILAEAKLSITLGVGFWLTGTTNVVKAGGAPNMDKPLILKLEFLWHYLLHFCPDYFYLQHCNWRVLWNCEIFDFVLRVWNPIVWIWQNNILITTHLIFQPTLLLHLQ